MPFQLIGGPKRSELVEELPDGYVRSAEADGGGVTTAWWHEHEVQLLFHFDNGEDQLFAPVFGWRFLPAHEDSHRAEYVVHLNVQAEEGLPEGVTLQSYVRVQADRVLYISLFILNGPHTHSPE